MSALPSGRARGLAFAAIVVAGVCGGLIGALLGAGGVAVVAVLVLRAMGEWQRIAAEQGEDAEGDEPDGDEGVPKDL